MRLFLLSIFALAFSGQAFAFGLEGITCTAEQWVVRDNAIHDHHKLEMKEELEGGFRFLKANVGGYAYTVNPNSSADELMITQSWGEGYTSGVMTTAAFGSSKRVQLSVVDKNKVWKIVCLKQ